MPQPNKITRTLYNGEITIDFFPESHRYKMAGDKKYLTSVTAITGVFDKSRALVIWAIRLCQEYFNGWLGTQDGSELVKAQVEEVFGQALIQHTLAKEKAASVGDKVHDFAEEFAKSRIHGAACPEIPEDEDDQVINGITAFLEWVNSNDITFHEAELLLYSKEHDYVGLTDVVATVNGKKYLLDYKTASGVYPDHRWQAAAYRHAYEEERGEKLDGIMILHFNKDTGEVTPHIIAEEDYPKDFQAFVGCRMIKARAKELDDEWRAKQKELVIA